MSENKPLPSLARAGSGLVNLAPSRSRTDPPTPPKERGSLHRRLHSNTIAGRITHGSSHHHHHRHRDTVKETIQSAVDLKPPISFDHLLRRDKKSPDSSRRGSGSQHQHQQRDPAEEQARQHAQAEKEAKLKVDPQDVEKAKAANAKREEGIRQSLKRVEELGMSSTRQLDDTYYAILEKASILRSTVVSLQQLAEESRRMHKQFEEDTTALERDTKANIESFGNFDEQEKTIDALVSRLKGSKTETQKLNDRLEAARSRVEAFEKREEARQSKRRKQWHATWGTLLGVLVVIVAILVFQNKTDVVQEIGGVGQTLASLSKAVADQVSSVRSSPSSSEDPYLRELLDEL
jgi:hypothetical protein